MDEKLDQLHKLEWLLAQLQEIGGNLIVDNKIQMVLEAENEQLLAENEQLKDESKFSKSLLEENDQLHKENERLRSLMSDEIKNLSQTFIQLNVLQPIGKLLFEMTMLRTERDEELKANERRKTPIWDKQEALSELAEQKRKLLPLGSGLHVKWCKDPSFECYVIVYD